jgi:hypothetical protein
MILIKNTAIARAYQIIVTPLASGLLVAFYRKVSMIIWCIIIAKFINEDEVIAFWFALWRRHCQFNILIIKLKSN